MSSNGSRPAPYRRGPRVSRRVALLVGAVAVLLVAGVLVAPVVILGGGSGGTRCAQSLAYKGVGYDARRVGGAVQSVATGVGVVSGCNQPASNVDVRSLAGIPTGHAVALAGDSTSVYVRHGLCPELTGDRLLACLRR
ncbi:MAG TPA: hypothetical protein VFJ91_13145 [Gaiellaceae bacterium]|nr:hypothetical protein [Gaiellaceae bacterium]